MVAVSFAPSLAQAATGTTLDATAPASWIEIHADNTVHIRTGKCDFGQSSIYTAYRQIVAEELDMPMSAMTEVISGDTDRTPDGGGTFGLLRTNVLNLRKAAAYTREAVLTIAAQKLGVDKASLSIKDGVISGGGKSATYGDIVKGGDFKLTIPVSGDLMSPRGLVVDGNPPLKKPADYKIVGQPMMNPTIRPKMAGTMPYVGDIKLPGMLHARSIHARNARFDTRFARARSIPRNIPAPKLVVIGNLVAVVSENEWEAINAAQPSRCRYQMDRMEGPARPRQIVRSFANKSRLVGGSRPKRPL